MLETYSWTHYRGDDHPLSKRYEFKDGKILKLSAFPLSSGSATVKKARTLRDFASFVDTLDEFSAIGSGIPKEIANKEGEPSIKILPEKILKDFDSNTHTSRTRKTFIFPSGRGLLWLDFDEMPNGSVYSEEELDAILCKVTPWWREIERFYRPSVSSFIKHESSGMARGRTGMRAYAIIDKAENIPFVTAAIADALWKNEHGWIGFSKDGKRLDRCLIDLSKWQPESLDYAGAPVLGKGLVKEHHDPWFAGPEGRMLDSEAVIAQAGFGKLSVSEWRKQSKDVNAAKDASLKEAQKRRDAWIDEKVDEDAASRALTASEKAGLREKWKRTLESKVLPENFQIVLQDGRKVTVAEILADLASFDGRYCCDPFEPGYRDNPGVAQINALNEPHIWSFAHGGRYYKLQDAVEETPDWVRDMNKEFAFIVIGGKSVILRDREGLPLDLWTKGAFLDYHANKLLQLEDGKKKNVADVWIHSKGRRGYDRIDFNPGGTPEGTFNLWRGFSVKPSPEGSCFKFKKHLFENICQGDEALYKWLLTWLADVIQNPHRKSGVAVTLKSKERGTGKSFVGHVMRKLIGKIHSCSISQQSQLTGNFNRHLEQALFVQVEEAIWAGNRQAENVLNDLITSDTIYIERKGVEAVPVYSVMRLLITSNNDWVIPAGANERRHAVFEVGDEHAKDRPYFGAIQTELENGGYERLMYELQTRKFKNADPCVAPDTDALLEQKLHSLDTFDRWWFDQLKEGELWVRAGDLWPEKRTAYEVKEFREKFEEFEKKQKGTYRKMTHEELGNAYIELCQGCKKGKSVNRMDVYTNMFCRVYGNVERHLNKL